MTGDCGAVCGGLRAVRSGGAGVEGGGADLLVATRATSYNITRHHAMWHLARHRHRAHARHHTMAGAAPFARVN